ncbi:hypothetical protein ACJIZ3_018169 [Penstemon smallii]|uniref:SANT domain-containing protein n=1 Tax=Penstemon smallii TaxID=265156 RepID=A0ABD3SXK5_9LAMI
MFIEHNSYEGRKKLIWWDHVGNSKLTFLTPKRGILSKNGTESVSLDSNMGSDCWVPFPGLTSTKDWSDADKASFLVGLYIFQKNFVEVRRFIETKDMGEILKFYYGEFHRSDQYRRWSDYPKKTKSKKLCVCGKTIFSGLRHQELLSRLLPTLSKARSDALSKVSKSYGDKKMSLAKYVSSLKAIVGMNVLVEAIGIGKEGKQDLTRMDLVLPSRSTNLTTTPTRKACSPLTTSEIIEFLTGDCRLSKARSNELFWEAVWPRLLARGWRSEQPTEHCMVFLVPGDKELSRRELVKGDNYFDSIADVLTKVAKEPKLIEQLDIEGNENENKNDDGLPSQPRNCYLRPSSTPDHRMVFTIVDTSLPEVVRVRGLPTQSYEDTPPTIDESLTKSGGEMQDPNLTLYPSDIGKASAVGNLKTQKHLHESKKRSRKLNVSSLEETVSSSKLEKGMSSCSSSIHEFDKNLSSRSSPPKENETRTSIDLNVAPDNDKFAAIDLGGSEPPFIGNERRRRHSTRNRPPTSRALEAIADGYLTVNQRRKSKDNSSLASSSRPLKRALSVSTASTDFQVKPEADEESVSGH